MAISLTLWVIWCAVLTHVGPVHPIASINAPLASAEPYCVVKHVLVALTQMLLLVLDQQVDGQTPVLRVIHLLMDYVLPALKAVCLAQLLEQENVTLTAVALVML